MQIPVRRLPPPLFFLSEDGGGAWLLQLSLCAPSCVELQWVSHAEAGGESGILPHTFFASTIVSHFLLTPGKT